MHTRFRIIFCSTFILFPLLYACNKEKATEHDYPRVATGQVTNINAGGATFNGSFLQSGTEKIIDHGFLFGAKHLLTFSLDERISLGSSSGQGSFTATADRAMVAKKTYYVSAYAQTKSYTFYAEPVMFVSKGGLSPEIIQIVPGQGVVGDTVTIKGKNFSSSFYHNTVKFNDKPASFISVSDTAIVVHAPASEGKEFADIFVTVAEQTVQKISGFRYMKPIITGFYPREGVVGDIVKITGNYFPFGIEVYFAQTKAMIRKTDYKSAEVIVPACQNPQARISVTCDGLTGAAEQSFVYTEPR